jgi:hypothetical protein
MRHILVKPLSGGLYRYNQELGEFRCTHENAEITKACCSPFDIGDSGYVECGCGGSDSIYCPDCNNAEMTDDDAAHLSC